MVYGVCNKEGLLQHTLQRVFYSIRSPPSSWVTEICQMSGWWECHTQLVCRGGGSNPGPSEQKSTPYGVEDPLQRVLQQPLFVTFSKYWPSGPMPYISLNVRLFVCLFVCLLKSSSNVFLPPLPLGRFSHRVAMSVCVFFCLSAPSQNTHFRRSKTLY